MAEALISFVLEQLGSIAIHELVKEVELVAGVEKEVESLTNTLTMIQRLLKDADEKQVKEEAVKFWLEQLKDIIFDANDVLDEWITRILISKMQRLSVNAPIEDKVRSHLFSLFRCFKTVVVRHAIGVKIRELNGRLDGIATNKERYTLTESRIQNEIRPITSSIVDVSDIYGRHVDKQVIMSNLFGETSHHGSKVPVISIVGTGGFGKTTLAQLILKEEQVINYFEKKIWVCVSNPFDQQKVAKEIIEQATGKVIETIGWQALHMSLSEAVQGKRFILVLDDVWSFNSQIWKQLKTSLNGGAIGSRIIITTRDVKIAKLMGSTYIHRLGQLSDGDSWLMFQRIAFWRREDDLEILRDIAKDITKRCGGVPLSIKILASLMQQEKNIQDWRNVQASNIWDVQVQEGGEDFLPSILFSYYALPAELKLCLLYCAIFPKDIIIKKKTMVQLWMAQGFLGSDGSKDLEIQGARCFDNLSMRSFFQDFKEDSKGNITSCKMHDLVHDFVQFLSKSEACILEEGQEVKGVHVRHLSSVAFDKPSIYELRKLRTLRPISFDRYNPNKITYLGLLHQLTCLRVLDWSYSDLEEFPSEIERLLHLRYLNLSHTMLKELPETICNLINLQTLKLNNCDILAKLPQGIGKLCNLRHLRIEPTRSLKYLPQGIGRLICLRRLDRFIIGDSDMIEGDGCNISELKLLNHLQGELWISNLARVANGKEAIEAALEKKKNLQSLILYFRTSEELRNDDDDDEGILEGLVPHTNLEELKISFYIGTKLPDWISSLSNLVKLELVRLKELVKLPALGKLPFLEGLIFRHLNSVTHIGGEFYGLSSCGGGGRDLVQQIVFPKLKKLKFVNMDALEEWDLPCQKGNLNFFPNLVYLKIKQCKGLQTLPITTLGNLKSLESLTLWKLSGLKNFLGQEVMGILSTRKGSDVEEEENGSGYFGDSAVVLFPALTSLELGLMHEWEEETIPELKSTTSITIMPRLSKLQIRVCRKLKVIPFYMFSPAIKDLYISNCPQLTGLQPSLPPLLEKLELGWDVGILSTSLLPLPQGSNKYPNLYSFGIYESSQSTLPQGFNLLTSIRQLIFATCEFLDFKPDDLKHLTMLEQLTISDCSILAESFSGGEISSSSSHVYNVSIIEGSQMHDCICDNCEMFPLVGKLFKCKDCHHEGIGFDLCENCHNTPFKHTDLVKQHHRQGHTFELIANRVDNLVAVHPDDPSEDAKGGLMVAKSAEIEEQNKA